MYRSYRNVTYRSSIDELTYSCVQFGSDLKMNSQISNKCVLFSHWRVSAMKHHCKCCCQKELWFCSVSFIMDCQVKSHMVKENETGSTDAPFLSIWRIWTSSHHVCHFDTSRSFHSFHPVLNLPEQKRFRPHFSLKAPGLCFSLEEQKLRCLETMMFTLTTTWCDGGTWSWTTITTTMRDIQYAYYHTLPVMSITPPFQSSLLLHSSLSDILLCINTINTDTPFHDAINCCF